MKQENKASMHMSDRDVCSLQMWYIYDDLRKKDKKKLIR